MKLNPVSTFSGKGHLLIISGASKGNMVIDKNNLHNRVNVCPLPPLDVIIVGSSCDNLHKKEQQGHANRID